MPRQEPDDQEASYADDDQEADPSRYDDALYGQYDPDAEPAQPDRAFANDPYGYHPGYGDAPEEPAPKRRGGIATVAAVLALAVVGTGAAFAYRTYVGTPRNSGEPPIIKADTSPTKIVPVSAEAAAKVPDRLASSDGTEKIVPREEAPVDVNASASANSAPRMVFPPLNPNANPPSVASVAPNAPPPPSAGNGTLPSNQPHKIKTFSVRGDQADAAAAPATDEQVPAPKPPVAPRAAAPVQHPSPVNANASSANTPLSLTPQAAQPARRGAANSSGHHGACRAQRRVSGPGVLAAQRSGRPGLVPGPAGQVPNRAGIAVAVDQTCGSRRKGGLLPRHGGSIRVLGRSVAILWQSEDRGRTVRHPKELTAVSLTLRPRAG